MQKILRLIQNTTMYRIVLYSLCLLFVLALALSYFKLISPTPIDLITQCLYIVSVSVLANYILAKAFRVVTNDESVYITALILVLIIPPAPLLQVILLDSWVAILAQASKYILVWRKRHIFNPAAVAVVLTGYGFYFGADWWIGTVSYLIPVMAVMALVIVYKVRRFSMATAFLLSVLFSLIFKTFYLNESILNSGQLFIGALTLSPIFFFLGIMLTEPLTTPASNWGQIVYGILAGILFSDVTTLFGLGLTPELALVVVNFVSLIISPKETSILLLKDIREIGALTYEFIFTSKHLKPWKAGQFAEFTTPSAMSDTRGNRRYFTIASAPNNKELRLGIKMSIPSSEFKKGLMSLNPGQAINMTNIAGDFVLPKDKKKKIGFIAGGIGITPMKAMIDTVTEQNPRDIKLIYCIRSMKDAAYKSEFDEKTWLTKFFVVGEGASIGNILVGALNKEMLLSIVPDASERVWYISGPHGMVETFSKELKEINVKGKDIKTDYFPGF